MEPSRAHPVFLRAKLMSMSTRCLPSEARARLTGQCSALNFHPFFMLGLVNSQRYIVGLVRNDIEASYWT